MVYYIIKLILRIYFKVFFKKIHIEGIDNLPKNQPILFASNHQNAFLDATLIGYQMHRNVYFLVRSDLFTSKLIRKFFEVLHLIPIYRKDDKRGKLKENNEQTFKHCIELLEKKSPLLIFPEGTSRTEYGLRTFKKGAARLAFQTEEANDFNLGLQIIPVSINYENHYKSNSTIWIKYGEPISLKDKKKAYINSPARSTSELNLSIENAIRKNTIEEQQNHHQTSAMLSSAAKKNIKTTRELLSFMSSNTKPSVVPEKSWMKGLIKLLYFPTYIIVNSILKKVNDKDFKLSILCFGWLTIGGFQTLAMIILIWLLM